MLWGRAAGRCSIPGCRMRLVLDETETDDPALIGDMCHMVAESEDGPRGKSPLTLDQRNLYGNLLLLCRNHHGEIDNHVHSYTVERLQQVKSEHEAWVNQFLPGYDVAKQRDDETYAGYIDQWAKCCRLDDWSSWSCSVLSNGQPSLDVSIDKSLFELRKWLLVRVWPGRLPRLEASLWNFENVLCDFQETFRKHAQLPNSTADQLLTKKFYRIDEWNKEKYWQLMNRFNYHVDLVQDLMLELTRAANLVCDEVRASLMSTFHLQEGRLSFIYGPHMDLTWRQSVVQYSAEERAALAPYLGLNDFLIAREKRDQHFGKGKPPS